MNLYKCFRLKVLFFVSCFIIIVTVICTIAVYYNSVSYDDEIVSNSFDVVMDNSYISEFGDAYVNIINLGDIPVLLRIHVGESWYLDYNLDSYDPDGNVDKDIIPISNKCNGYDVVMKGWTDTFLDDFVLEDDGWYYYKKILNASDSISLISYIDLDYEVLDNCSNRQLYESVYSYKLRFNFEVIKVDSLTSNDMWGMQFTKDGNNVNWL